MSVWDDPQFAGAWNSAYGLDMSRAPIRAGIIYPLAATRICWPQTQSEAIKIADFGCGNGNFIRAFSNCPHVEWLGIDSGTAILATAQPLAKTATISFLKRDIGQEIPEVSTSPGFDHAVSIFTLEEISFEAMPAFFSNMAKAVHERNGTVHIFTQHPAYALHQDIISNAEGKPNDKFQGHRGYFDTGPTTYSLAILNHQQGIAAKPEHHHKPLAAITNGLGNVGLCLQEMLEIPAGVIDMNTLEAHQPKRGDVPRFLYLRATPS
jgi:Methyltransferase domain